MRDSGAPVNTTVAGLAAQIASNKSALLVHGRIAQVWGEFLRDGKINHCGVDSASLFKSPPDLWASFHAGAETASAWPRSAPGWPPLWNPSSARL